MSFQLYTTTNNRLYVSGGMSTEIGFAKYIAHRTKAVYAGWDINIRMVYPHIIEDTLKSVVKHVQAVETHGCARTILHSPGFLSVPYMTELCDFIYLPSQFLVGFNSFNELQDTLENAKKAGIKAYAVAGYDGCIPHCLVAWIKFEKMPSAYTDLIENFLGSDRILLAGVYNKDGKTTGENVIHRYNDDIYLLHIHSCYGQKTLDKDWEIFKGLTDDFLSDQVEKDKSLHIGDWESALDNMTRSYIKTDYKGLVYRACASDTLPLYKLTYELSRVFMAINKIPIAGIVTNPYIMNTPTYEATYGYLSFSYWAGSSFIDKELPKLIKRDMPIGGVLWFNDQNLQKKTLYDKLIKEFPINKHVYICNQTPLCDELTSWIEKYKPKTYPSHTPVSIYQLGVAMKEAQVKLDFL